MVSTRLRERNELVAPCDLVGCLAAVVGQRRTKRCDREIHLLRRDFLIANRKVPPDRVGFDVAADIGVDVVVAPQPVGIARRQPAATLHATVDLPFVDVERLPVSDAKVRIERAAILISSRFADELHVHTRRMPLRTVRSRVH